MNTLLEKLAKNTAQAIKKLQDSLEQDNKDAIRYIEDAITSASNKGFWEETFEFKKTKNGYVIKNSVQITDDNVESIILTSPEYVADYFKKECLSVSYENNKLTLNWKIKVKNLVGRLKP